MSGRIPIKGMVVQNVDGRGSGGCWEPPARVLGGRVEAGPALLMIPRGDRRAMFRGCGRMKENHGCAWTDVDSYHTL